MNMGSKEHFMYRDYFKYRDWKDRWILAKAEILGRFLIVIYKTNSALEAAKLFYSLGACPFCEIVEKEINANMPSEYPFCKNCKVEEWCKEWSDEKDILKFKPERVKYYSDKLLKLEV